MSIELKTGLLREASWRESPNFNHRPEGMEINVLVIHNISLPAREFGGSDIEDLFLNRLDTSKREEYKSLNNVTVSAHLLIRRTGEVLQFVPFHLRAWHAGVSSFEGRDGCNDFSIGIEMEGSDYEAFTDAQYNRLSVVTRALMLAYPAISTDRIVGHSDIAPGRKTDPGPFFDWDRFRRSL